MALAVAGLAAEGETIVHGAEVIDDSYPGFAAALRSLGAAIEAVEVDE
jgi:3-phosphoshikimate 1-carboxyvinyltransferase